MAFAGTCCPESIYTMKLARRGHYMPQALQANAHLVHHVSDMRLEPATVMATSTPVDELDVSEEPGPPFCVVLLDGDRVAGVLPRDWVLGHPSKVRSAQQLGDVASPAFVTVSKEVMIVDFLALLVASHADVAVVVSSSNDAGSDAKRVLGIVTKATLAETIAEGMELFGD